jgi:hypothetical protein
MSIPQLSHFPFKQFGALKVEFFIGHIMDVHIFVKPWNVVQPVVYTLGMELPQTSQVQLHHLPSLVEICDFATNEFVTSCDYLTFTTTVGYIYNYCLHLKPLATTL